MGQHEARTRAGSRTLTAVFLFVTTLTVMGGLQGQASAQGGCGSVCIPLDALTPLPRPTLEFDLQMTAADSLDAAVESMDADPEGVRSTPGGQAVSGIDVLTPQSARAKFRVTFTSEFADFKNFREGEEKITSPAGNRAFIAESGLFIDYFAKERFTLTLLATHVKKNQFHRVRGFRRAIGFGDLAVLGNYQLVQPCEHGRGPSIWLGCGMKFPNASIDEPTGQPRLPPAFQVGSGAHDLIPTIAYFQEFDNFSLFGSYFARLPLERNNIGYRFGQEHEIHFGIRRPLPYTCDKLEMLLSLDYLNAFHDSDFGLTLPAQVRDGILVLNTGGEFLSVTPGVSWRVTPRLVSLVRFFLPAYQDWNGDRSRNVGQVAPDFTTQVTVSYLH